MLSTGLLFTLCTLCSLLITPCTTHLSRRQTSNSTLAGEVIGNDPPQPPSTYGYAINHVALQVSNITETRAFWGDVLGLRFIFSFSVANDATSGTDTVTFMGYPYGDGKIGNQTGPQLLGDLRKRDGLMEFLSTDVRLPLLLSRPTMVLENFGIDLEPLSPVKTRYDY